LEGRSGSSRNNSATSIYRKKAQSEEKNPGPSKSERTDWIRAKAPVTPSGCSILHTFHVVNFGHLDGLTPMSLGLAPLDQFSEFMEGSKPGMASKSGLGVSRTLLRKKFRAGMTLRNYRDNEAVFSQGDPADSVFYIESGTVKLTAVSARKKAIIAIVRRGSFFGEGCLAGQPLRISTARSIGQSNVIRLQKERMVRRRRKDPQFERLFVGCLL
jgi:hypothetical protein